MHYTKDNCKLNNINSSLGFILWGFLNFPEIWIQLQASYPCNSQKTKKVVKRLTLDLRQRKKNEQKGRKNSQKSNLTQSPYSLGYASAKMKKMKSKS